MTTEWTCNPGAFGEVLEELMRARDLEPDPENIRRLAARSGLDADGLLRSMVAEQAEDLGPLNGLDTEMGLSQEEMNVLAQAYVYNRGTAEEARAAARMNERESIVTLLADLDDEEGVGYIREHVTTTRPEELARECREACGVLEGLVVMSEALGWATLTVLSDARSRAQEALRQAESLS